MRVLHFPSRASASPHTDHPSASDVAAYIDRSLPDTAREHVERHLADCALCREELAASARLTRSIPPRQRSRILLSGLGIAAAAGVALAVVALPRNRSANATRERAVGPIADQIAIVFPRPGSTIGAADIRFVWRADSTAAGYRVIVTTAAGTPVWSREVSDTSVAPPRQTTFVDGGEFFWRVEASRANGETPTSRTASFRIVGR